MEPLFFSMSRRISDFKIGINCMPRYKARVLLRSIEQYMSLRRMFNVLKLNSSTHVLTIYNTESECLLQRFEVTLRLDFGVFTKCTLRLFQQFQCPFGIVFAMSTCNSFIQRQMLWIVKFSLVLIDTTLKEQLQLSIMLRKRYVSKVDGE